MTREELRLGDSKNKIVRKIDRLKSGTQTIEKVIINENKRIIVHIETQNIVEIRQQ
jgi:hypothetical protein